MDARSLHNLPVLIALLFAASVSDAAPNLRAGFVVNDIKLYPDHKDPALLYYMPSPLRLSKINDKPVFRFDLFRYVGRKETGDSAVFRVRGVLTFEIERSERLSDYQALRAAVQRKYPRAVLRPAPITGFESKLVYRTVESDRGRQSETGSIEGGVSKVIDVKAGISKAPNEEQTGPIGEGNWKRRRFTIGLRPRTAELFWRGFKENRLLLSLAYTWRVRGVVSDQKTNGQMRESTADLTDSLPITVSMTAYPDAFVKTDIGQVMEMGHTVLTVICYDFINETKPDLYSVTVEVMFRTLRGQDYVERVQFSENDESYEKEVSFRLAKNLGAGYQYRVQRLFRDGRHETTGWKRHHGQQLDVTYYVN